MAQYSNLKAYIEEKIYENGTQAITGDILQDVLKVMTDDLGEFYQTGGVASPSTDPGTPDAKVIYFATEAGTYTNFGGITLAAGEVALLIFETSWTKETLNVLSSANGGVKTANLADGAVTTAKIANGAVEEGKIADASVTSGKLGSGAVTTEKIADGAATTDKLADKAVATGKLGDKAVTSGKIADKAVGTGQIADEAITEGKIADEAVTAGKIADGAVTNGKINDGAVTEGKIGSGAVTTAKIGSKAVTTAKIADKAVTSGQLGDKAVTTDKIADGAVGSDQLAEGAFSAQNLADGSVTTDKLADDAVTAEKIADGAVTAGKFANGSVTTIKLGSGAVTTEKIGDGMVTRQKLADSSVGTSKIIDGAVTTAKVADANVTTAKIADANVTTGKLADGAVTTAKIADGNVTGAKLQEGVRPVINVNALNEQSTAYGSAALARAAVPSALRILGLHVIYLLAGGWFEDEFIGSDVSGWGTASNWRAVGPVSVSQNTQTGGWQLKVGDTTILEDKFPRQETLYAISEKYTLKSVNMVQGTWSQQGVKNNDSTRITTIEDLIVEAGTVIHFTPAINCEKMFIRVFDMDEPTSLVQQISWVSVASDVLIEHNGIVRITVAKSNDSDILPSEFDATIVIDNSLVVESLTQVIKKGGIEVGATGGTYIDSDEWLEVTLDSNNRIIKGIKKDGTTYVYKLEGDFADDLVKKENGKSLINEEFADGVTYDNFDENIEATLDKDDKVLSYRDKSGRLHENCGIKTNSLELTSEGMTEFQQALKKSGFNPGGKGDWSDYISADGKKPLHIAEPRCGHLNIIWDGDLTQLSKMGYNYDPSVPTPISGVNCEIPCQVEFYDNQGNYFKKWVEMSGQGRSSMRYVKKNISLDFFDSEFGGDAFSVKFGNWIPQDSFHLKAYYTDFFRGAGVSVYKIAKDIYDQKEPLKNRTWKKGLLSSYNIGSSTVDSDVINDIKYQTDCDAMCQPDGFPVIVYQNGEFYGIFSWQIKKARDNYMMKKTNAKHIHLDAEHINNSTLFDGVIDWTEFEIRNPKNLCYQVVHTDLKGKATFKYDSDIEDGLDEIAGKDRNYDGDWAAGSYAVGRVVKHNSNYFINQVNNNSLEPTTIGNTKEDPDFKNKTGCGWINCGLSVEVKEYIQSLAGRCAEINAASTDEGKKALLNTYFDTENLIDYELIQMVTGNYDAFNSNWQWTTWDGVKWFVNEYDADCSFGGLSFGNTILPPCLTGQYGVDYKLDYTSQSGIYAYKYAGPLRFIETLYTQEREEQYNALRSSGTISVISIYGKFKDWLQRFGSDSFEKEYKKWTDCMTNIATKCNTGWKLHSYNTASEYRSISPFNSATTYTIGQVCKYENVLVEATETVQGIVPITVVTHKDNIFRLYEWIKERISLLDSNFNYN